MTLSDADSHISDNSENQNHWVWNKPGMTQMAEKVWELTAKTEKREKVSPIRLLTCFY